jgi:hypothetical protein
MKPFVSDHLGSSWNVFCDTVPFCCMLRKHKATNNKHSKGRLTKCMFHFFDVMATGLASHRTSRASHDAMEQVRRMMLKSLRQPVLESKPKLSHAKLHL